MSVLAVRDLVFGSLLNDLKMNPYWELIRGYFFAASAGLSLFLIYILLPTPDVKCLPLTGNVALQKQFTSQEATLINSFCGNQLPWYLGYAGLLSLIFVVILMIVSSFWLYHPDIVNSFQTFAKAEEIIRSLNLSTEEMKSASFKPLDRNIEENVKVRQACNLLWNYNSKVSVYKWYFVRNCILLVTVLGSVGVSTYMLFELGSDRDMFHCNATGVDEFNTYNNFRPSYFCTFNASKRLFPFMLAYIITLFAQAVFTVIGMLKMIKPQDNMLNYASMMCSDTSSGKFTKHGMNAAVFANFMVKFWKNSRPVSSGSFSQLVNFIFSHVFSPMKRNLLLAISIGFSDNQLIELYSLLKKGGGNEVLEIVRDTLARKFDLYDGTYSKLCDVITYIKGEMSWDEKCSTFLKEIYEKELWEMFALIISLQGWTKSDEEKNIKGFLKNLEINPNIIGYPHHSEKSILFYVLSTTKNGTVNIDGARRFLQAMHDDQKKYVHFDGITKEAGIFFTEDGCDIPGIECENVLDLIHSSQTQIKTSGTNVLKISLTEHQAESEEKERSDEYSDYMLKFSSKISRMRFTKWSVDTKALLRYAYDKKQWMIFVEILNSYIDSDYMSQNTEENPLGNKIQCEIEDFDVSGRLNDETSNGGSILYYAMTRPKYRKCYVPTAARHILSCTKGKEKIVNDGFKTKQSASAFVEQTILLSTDDKKLLHRLIKESNKQPLLHSDSPMPQQVNTLSESSSYDQGEESGIASPNHGQGNAASTPDAVLYCNEKTSLLPETSKNIPRSGGDGTFQINVGALKNGHSNESTKSNAGVDGGMLNKEKSQKFASSSNENNDVLVISKAKSEPVLSKYPSNSML